MYSNPIIFDVITRYLFVYHKGIQVFKKKLNKSVQLAYVLIDPVPVQYEPTQCWVDDWFLIGCRSCVDACNTIAFTLKSFTLEAHKKNGFLTGAHRSHKAFIMSHEPELFLAHILRHTKCQFHIDFFIFLRHDK